MIGSCHETLPALFIRGGTRLRGGKVKGFIHRKSLRFWLIVMGQVENITYQFYTNWILAAAFNMPTKKHDTQLSQFFYLLILYSLTKTFSNRSIVFVHIRNTKEASAELTHSK